MLATMLVLLAAAVAWFLWERGHRKTEDMRGRIRWSRKGLPESWH